MGFGDTGAFPSFTYPSSLVVDGQLHILAPALDDQLLWGQHPLRNLGPSLACLRSVELLRDQLQDQKEEQLSLALSCQRLHLSRVVHG